MHFEVDRDKPKRVYFVSLAAVFATQDLFLPYFQ